jgi:threonine dehydratase
VTGEERVVGIDDVRRVHELIAPHVLRTPVLRPDVLTGVVGRPTAVKLELLQHSGSFKARGAFARMLSLDAGARAAGVVAVSGGNHALAVAHAARALGVRATVVLPTAAPRATFARCRADGAEVVEVATIGAGFAEAERRAAAGVTFVHPFDHPEVVAGQGTVALELVEQLDDVTDVVVSVGGGGLLTGTGVVLDALRPGTRLWGVETVGAEAMTQALAAGHPVDVEVTSIASTLGAPRVSRLTLDGARRHSEEVVLVPDAEAVAAVVELADTLHLVTEPAAACTLVAARRIAARSDPRARFALVLCGGNVTLDDVAGWRTRFA